MTGGRGRRHKQLLDDRNETSGHCKLKDEALYRTPWRIGSERGCGPVVRQNKIAVQYTMSEVVIGTSCAELFCEVGVFQSVVSGTSLGIPLEIVE